MRDLMKISWPTRYIEVLIEVKAKTPEMNVFSAADMATQRRCATRKKPQTPDRLANQWFAQIHVCDNRPGNADSDTLYPNAKSNNISFKRINSQLTDVNTNKTNLKIFLPSLLRI